MSGTNASGRKGRTKKDVRETRSWTQRCPENIPARAKRYWKKVVQDLSAKNVLDDLDSFALLRMCRIYDWWLEAQETIDREGLVYEVVLGHGGVTKKEHPAVKQVRDLNNDLTRLEKQFGMSPLFREGIKAHKGKVSRSIRDQYSRNGAPETTEDDYDEDVL